MKFKIKRKKTVIAISCIAIILIALGAKKVLIGNKLPRPEIYEVNKSNMNFAYNVTGKVESQKVISVFSTNMSEVENVVARLNDTVNKGDVLLNFKKDTSNTQALNIAKANSVLPNLRQNYEAAKKIYSVGGISKEQLNDARQALQSAVIDSKIASSGYKPQERVLRSPISGVIVEANADDNYKIDPTKPLYKIADTENLKITLDVPNYMAKNLKVGQTVDITSDSLNDDEVLHGVVKNIAKISTKSETSNDAITSVEVSLDNYSTLKPGDIVDAKINYLTLNNNIIIPLQYIEFENDKTYVYILNNKNIVERREVKLGKNNTINYVVKSGLSVHDKLINNSSKIYKQGDKIK